MPEYSPSQRIIDLSLEELKYILQWVRAREGNDKNIVTVLKVVGPWMYIIPGTVLSILIW